MISDSILIEKRTRDDYISQIESLTQQVNQKNKNKQEKAEQIKANNQKKIAEMEMEIEHAELENKQRYDDLFEERRKIEESFERTIEDLKRKHQEEMEKRKMEYAEKNEADQQRMIELEQQKVLEKDQYLQQIMELRRVHTKIISELEKEQTL